MTTDIPHGKLVLSGACEFGSTNGGGESGSFTPTHQTTRFYQISNWLVV